MISALLLALLFLSHRPTTQTPECPVPLPLDPIFDRPLLPNDPRLKSLQQELQKSLYDKLGGIDSAVILVVHGGGNILEWSHGRIRSNVTAKEDDRKVGPDTIWRVASITKVSDNERTES